ncbi:hypothetical protein BH23GEM4_BH23GEM4_12630 [soil metagenome]
MGGVWAIMLGVVLGCIVSYGRNIPLAADWLMVAPLTGHEPDLAGWLWAQNNEHRVPLPRLLYLLLLKASGGDFRVGMVFNALAMAALAAAMVLAARRLRGGTLRLSDAFFPVAFLHLGNWSNLVWSWQIQFVLATVLTCGLLLVAVKHAGDLPPRDACIAGTCILLLPLSGANGLIFAVAMAPWLLFSALRMRAVTARRDSVMAGYLLLAAVAGALLLTVLYFVGYQRASWNPPSPGVGATLKTAAKFLALGFGPAARAWWGVTELLALGIAGSTLGLLLAALRRRDQGERRRLFGLVSFAVGMATLALALGWGRAGLLPRVGMPPRYVLLSVPALCLAYFVWQLYGPPRYRSAVQLGLLGVMLALLPFNTRAGFGWRNWYSAGMLQVEQDIGAGLTAQEIAQRNGDFLLHWDQPGLVAFIEMLRASGNGPFAAIVFSGAEPSTESSTETSHGMDRRIVEVSRAPVRVVLPR